MVTLIELLESHSLPLINVELEELEWQTYEKAQDGCDDERVISEDNTLAMKMFKRTLEEN
jgi:hypothetical protein